MKKGLLGYFFATMPPFSDLYDNYYGNTFHSIIIIILVGSSVFFSTVGRELHLHSQAALWRWGEDPASSEENIHPRPLECLIILFNKCNMSAGAEGHLKRQ